MNNFTGGRYRNVHGVEVVLVWTGIEEIRWTKTDNMHEFSGQYIKDRRPYADPFVMPGSVVLKIRSDFERYRRFSPYLNLETEDLDDLVHECKTQEAAEINNSGPEDQLQYLVDSGVCVSTLEEIRKDRLLKDEYTTTATLALPVHPGDVFQEWRSRSVMGYSVYVCSTGNQQPGEHTGEIRTAVSVGTANVPPESREHAPHFGIFRFPRIMVHGASLWRAVTADRPPLFGWKPSQDWNLALNLLYDLFVKPVSFFVAPWSETKGICFTACQTPTQNLSMDQYGGVAVVEDMQVHYKNAYWAQLGEAHKPKE